MVTGVLLLVIVAAFIYLVDPTFFGLLKKSEGFSVSAGGAAGSASAAMAQLAAQAAGMQGRNRQGFTGSMTATGEAGAGQMSNPGATNIANLSQGHVAAGNLRPSAAASTGGSTESFADLSDYEGPADFGAAGAPAGCYPRDQLTPSELLPKDQNSVWAEQNPMGPGSLKGKNFLSAGALIGVNTVGQSLRNANWQLRSEPPNPQQPVSIFNQSTIQPDTNRRPLEIN